MSAESVVVDVELMGAGDEVAESEVCVALGAVKWMDMMASESGEVLVRSIVIGMAGLWYLRRTSSWRQNFLH